MPDPLPTANSCDKLRRYDSTATAIALRKPPNRNHGDVGDCREQRPAAGARRPDLWHEHRPYSTEVSGLCRACARTVRGVLNICTAAPDMDKVRLQHTSIPRSAFFAATFRALCTAGLLAPRALQLVLTQGTWVPYNDCAVAPVMFGKPLLNNVLAFDHLLLQK